MGNPGYGFHKKTGKVLLLRRGLGWVVVVVLLGDLRSRSLPNTPTILPSWILREE